MKNIVFLEGVSGAGKSSCVQRLCDKLEKKGMKVKGFLEGDADSPLDLCWTAYLLNAEYEALATAHPKEREEMEQNSLCFDDHRLVRYRKKEKKLYSAALYEQLRGYEFCYQPQRSVPMETFKRVFLDLWRRFGLEHEGEWDYLLFDGSLISHTTNDLLRNYDASAEKIAQHVNTLLQAVYACRPIVFYLQPENVQKRLQEARGSRSQEKASQKQIRFWEERLRVDGAVFPLLQTEKHVLKVDGENWDSLVEKMEARLLVQSDGVLEGKKERTAKPSVREE